jgi:hypothetical protein
LGRSRLGVDAETAVAGSMTGDGRATPRTVGHSGDATHTGARGSGAPTYGYLFFSVKFSVLKTQGSPEWLRSRSAAAFADEFQQQVAISVLADVHEK